MTYDPVVGTSFIAFSLYLLNWQYRLNIILATTHHQLMRKWIKTQFIWWAVVRWRQIWRISNCYNYITARKKNQFFYILKTEWFGVGLTNARQKWWLLSTKRWMLVVLWAEIQPCDCECHLTAINVRMPFQNY